MKIKQEKLTDLKDLGFTYGESEEGYSYYYYKESMFGNDYKSLEDKYYYECLVFDNDIGGFKKGEVLIQQTFNGKEQLLVPPTRKFKIIETLIYGGFIETKENKEETKEEEIGTGENDNSETDGDIEE